MLSNLIWCLLFGMTLILCTEGNSLAHVSQLLWKKLRVISYTAATHDRDKLALMTSKYLYSIYSMPEMEISTKS